MELNEACGVFGIFAPGEDVARITYFGIYSLQHRGQESAGIAVGDGQEINIYAQMGLVSQVFKEASLTELKGHLAIGHTRYSTTGSSKQQNVQPVIVNGARGQIAVGHNGNLVNTGDLRDELIQQGHVFNSTSDTEVMARMLVEAPGHDWVEAIQSVMSRILGAYSVVILTPNQLFGFRDPMGVRPLCIGRRNGAWVLASESCALDTVGADFIREVEPGEIVMIDKSGITSVQGHARERSGLCVFEYIYFARPDSVINSKLVYLARERMGRQLARDYQVDADLVIAVPDSAVPAGIGFAREANIPFSEGLIKSRYIYRTFIQPDQRLREVGINLKFNPLPEVLNGKRVVVVDDSIVRGNTTRSIVRLLRRAGAREIHLRIHAPPMCYPCVLGVDTARRKELIAARMSVPEIRDYVGADSLGYLGIDGLVESIGLPRETFCLACFNGDYPVPIQLDMDKLAFEKSNQ